MGKGTLKICCEAKELFVVKSEYLEMGDEEKLSALNTLESFIGVQRTNILKRKIRSFCNE
jgi:hypothetical protein